MLHHGQEGEIPMAVFEVTEPRAVREGEVIVVSAKGPSAVVQFRMSANDALDMMQAIQKALIIGRPPKRD